MPVTIKDIAKKAGVSHTTVSRALNGNPSIPEKTAQSIKELAESMGYFPSAAARGLRTKRSHAIGVIVSRIDNPYFGEIVLGIEDALKQTGYSLFVASSHMDFSIEKNIIHSFAEHRVDGVIICSVTIDTQHANFLKQYGMPIAVVNNESPDEFSCSIAHDDVDGARQLTQYMLSLGHQNIAYFGNALAKRINHDRLSGFCEAIEQTGFMIDQKLILEFPGGEIENGVVAMNKLIQSTNLPTAVFCFNDLMAIGALKVLNDNGIKVPEEISITGFDNIPFSGYTFPPLTTFDQPKRNIGSEAARMLLDLLNSKGSTENKAPLSRIMRGQLLIRESTSFCQQRRN